LQQNVEERVWVGTTKTALIIGATSFGGVVVAHLRNSLVIKWRWFDDKTFVELLTITQMLPGLKAANIAVLAGDRLPGTFRALPAIAGICLPGAFVIYIVGILYAIERERPLLDAALVGVAASAVGLIFVTTLQLGRNSFSHADDVAFMCSR
jgi:chromate transporter